mmetsp:Transcript_19447/g.46896  ORF Transcript_19447/g.46896 Transcript_19447/m.46896 type:complete len:285 (-) Transcript_19447:296-1150(-)
MLMNLLGIFGMQNLSLESAACAVAGNNAEPLQSFAPVFQRLQNLAIGIRELAALLQVARSPHKHHVSDNDSVNRRHARVVQERRQEEQTRPCRVARDFQRSRMRIHVGQCKRIQLNHFLNSCLTNFAVTLHTMRTRTKQGDVRSSQSWIVVFAQCLEAGPVLGRSAPKSRCHQLRQFLTTSMHKGSTSEEQFPSLHGRRQNQSATVVSAALHGDGTNKIRDVGQRAPLAWPQIVLVNSWPVVGSHRTLGLPPPCTVQSLANCVVLGIQGVTPLQKRHCILIPTL